MPSTENGTLQAVDERPTTERSNLRIVGEPVAPPIRRRNAALRPREYLTPA
jgi:hypothetical protein